MLTFRRYIICNNNNNNNNNDNNNNIIIIIIIIILAQYPFESSYCWPTFWQSEVNEYLVSLDARYGQLV